MLQKPKLSAGLMGFPARVLPPLSPLQHWVSLGINCLLNIHHWGGGGGGSVCCDHKVFFMVFQSLHCEMSGKVVIAKPSQQLVSMVADSVT